MVFIQDLTSLNDLTHELISKRQALSNLFGCAHQQINRCQSIQFVEYLDCLLCWPPFERHHYEQINIGVGPRMPIRMRAEENDLLRMKVASDLLA